jgi:hypothetical protein
MGSLQSAEMARLVHEDNLELEMALRWHLRGNHYPPVHEVFVPVALQAIWAVNRDEHDLVIEMPNGLTKSAGEIVEELHLEWFLEDPV